MGKTKIDSKGSNSLDTAVRATVLPDGVTPLDDDDKRLLEGARTIPVEGSVEPEVDEDAEEFGIVEFSNSPPEWAIVPPKLVIPRGRTIYYFRFYPEWTDRADKGERQCIVWSLSMADELFAFKRARGDSFRVGIELAMASVRAIDGVAADPNRSNVSKWFDEIGARCRQMIQSHYMKTHSLTDEDKIRFFASCQSGVRYSGE